MMTTHRVHYVRSCLYQFYELRLAIVSVTISRRGSTTMDVFDQLNQCFCLKVLIRESSKQIMALL
jgi:hypothetical protein